MFDIVNARIRFLMPKLIAMLPSALVWSTVRHLARKLYFLVVLI